MFEVGDIIVGREEDRHRYAVTTSKCNFVGEVLYEYGEMIEVVVREHDDWHRVGSTYEVQSRYFKLKNQPPVEGFEKVWSRSDKVK